MAAGEFEYGVISRRGAGERFLAVGLVRFAEALETGKLVAFKGENWVVGKVHEGIRPPVVVLNLAPSRFSESP